MLDSINFSTQSGVQKAAAMLAAAMGLPEGERPFPWQMELLRRFCEGDAISAIDIPTGLGKTAVMAVWLVARAHGAKLPRRLVYVVDRRVVVDQATEVEKARYHQLVQCLHFVSQRPVVQHWFSMKCVLRKYTGALFSRVCISLVLVVVELLADGMVGRCAINAAVRA